MKLKNNIRLFYGINFLEACVFTVPIWTFFFTSYLNFSFGVALFLVLLSGTISFLFEIPSGAWADRLGRKKMFLLGILFAIISLSFYIFSHELYLYIISAIIGGIGYAMLSGNFEALIHDNLEELGEEGKFKDISSNQYISLFLGRAFSASIAGFLFTIHPTYPAIATIMMYIIILFAVLFIHEPKQQISEAKTNHLHIKEVLHFLFQHKALLYFIVIISIQCGLGNIYWFTYQPYLEKVGYSIEFIGVIFALTGLFSALGSYTIKILQDYLSEKYIINIMLIGQLIVGLVFITFNSILAIIGIIISAVIAGFLMPLGNNYLIKKCPKTHKSTILSIFSFSITLGYISFALPTGFLVDIIGLERVYFGVIFLILATIILHNILFRKTGNS